MTVFVLNSDHAGQLIADPVIRKIWNAAFRGKKFVEKGNYQEIPNSLVDGLKSAANHHT